MNETNNWTTSYISAFRFGVERLGSPSGLRLTWSSVANASYQVQSTTNLASGQWKDVGEPLLGTGGIQYFFVEQDPSEVQCFYRVTRR
jgi:hypothetical protein